jgi:LuxR family transcriptional regulator, maltose regulon positive regulatory protein
VLAALSDIRVDLLDEGWSATVSWFRHVAHRRAGDLDRAELVLDGAMSLTIGGDEQTELAHLHVAWLRGRVDHVRDHLPALEQRFRAMGNRYLHVEVALELAARLAWLGDRHRARELLDEMTPLLAEMPGALVQILRLIAAAAVAIEDGDDATAAALLAENSHAVPGRADNWYWRDRTALALPYLLEPQWRETWDVETTSPTHRVGIELAGALEAARRGDMATVGALSWPEPGIARAHLPLRWLAELAAAGVAAGNPPDPRLLDALGDSLRPTLQDIVTVGAAPALGSAVAELAARIPALPTQHLTIAVLGPLEVRRDDVVIDHPDLARRRVRELLSLLVARRRIRREVAADLLWPEKADPRHNLRVTLNYLQGILEPDRPRSEPTYFLRPAGDTLALVSSDRLRCDVWDLVAHLDAADQAERAGDPAAALAAYQAALPLWRGDPYDDIGDLDWVRDEQRQLTSRYTLAALRAGELLLAKQAAHEARGAAEHALKADPAHEPAYQLLVRAHLALDDTRGARRALDACLLVLADLAVEPSGSTVELLSTLTRR